MLRRGKKSIHLKANGCILWKWHSENSTSTSLDASDIHPWNRREHKNRPQTQTHVYLLHRKFTTHRHPSHQRRTDERNDRTNLKRIFDAVLSKYCLPFPIFNFSFLLDSCAPPSPSGHIHTAHNKQVQCTARIHHLYESETTKYTEEDRAHIHSPSLSYLSDEEYKLKNCKCCDKCLCFFKMIWHPSLAFVVGGRVSFVSPALSNATTLYVE